MARYASIAPDVQRSVIALSYRPTASTWPKAGADQHLRYGQSGRTALLAMRLAGTLSPRRLLSEKRVSLRPEIGGSSRCPVACQSSQTVRLLLPGRPRRGPAGRSRGGPCGAYLLPDSE